MDRPEGRVVAMTELGPYEAARNRLLMALAFAELAGILASIAVVVLFTKRSVRPLAQALALQRRFVADASHELRAPLTVLHTRAQLLAHRLGSADSEVLQKDADALVADTRALGDIVDDLLASATMTVGKPARDHVDMADVAASVRRAWPRTPSRSASPWPMSARSLLRQANTRSSAHRPRCAGR